MKQGSMIEEAYLILKEEGKELPFATLWARVREKLDINDEEAAERVGFFYSDLTLSGKIVALSNNNWDLRSRHKYEAVHIDVKDIYVDVEESDGDSVDEEENKAYDQSVEGFVATDDGEDLGESEETPKPEDASELLGIKKETLPEY